METLDVLAASRLVIGNELLRASQMGNTYNCELHHYKAAKDLALVLRYGKLYRVCPQCVLRHLEPVGAIHVKAGEPNLDEVDSGTNYD